MRRERIRLYRRSLLGALTLLLALAATSVAMSDPDNDGLTTNDPCPGDARNACFGLPALDPFTARPVRINTNTSSTKECAGDKIDCNGDLWTEDTRYNHLGKQSVCDLAGGGEDCVISGIVELFGCEDETTEDIFQCGHTAPNPAPDLGWDFPLDDGTYLVNVYFANADDDSTNIGDRLFDIIVEGDVAYASFDQVAAAGGSARAVVRSVVTEVDDGNGLQLSFPSIRDRASIKGIEVLGSDAGTCATTYVCPAETQCNTGTGLCEASGNFSDELVISGLDAPTSLAFLPDGRMIVLQKDGEILLVDDSSVPATSSSYLTLGNVEHSGEAGVLDLTLDPDFSNNNFVYIYYAHGSNSRHRISRFTHDMDHAHAEDEVMLWEDDQPYENCCHYGGGLDFGPDGKLYMTLGEKFDPPRAQDMTLAAGKIIRINKDGSIPTDNPFFDGSGPNYDAMWALGLRNPFRARFDEETGRLFMGDLGYNSIETVNVGASGANFGWPICEGDCEDPANYTDPIFKFQHIGGGHGIMGGIVYRGNQFPAAFDGVYFYGDYAAHWIRYLTFDGSSTTVTGNFDFLTDIGDVVFMEQSPDGALYYIRHDGSVRRIRHTAGNHAPVITQASASTQSGPAPLSVTFTGAGTDTENDPLSYRWIFGDGTEATTATAQHTYATTGSYSARLILSDPTHDVQSQPISISAGSAPTASIVAPLDGSFFNAGQVLDYQGDGDDPDETLDATDFSWQILLHHDGHLHPRQGPIFAISGSYATPTTGHAYGDTTHYELRLTVTDSDGLSDTDSVSVFPNIVDLTFDTEPTGIPIALDGIVLPTPSVIDEATGFQYTISATTITCVDDTEYLFSGWSDGGAAEHSIVVGSSDTAYIANYAATGPCDDATDPDNDGLENDVDPCPDDALNACFGRIAVDADTGNEIRLNANASTQHCAGSRVDCRGLTWHSDFGYNVAAKASACNLNGGDEACFIAGISGIFGCDDEATEDLFQCEHSDLGSSPELEYSFDVPNGLYLVNLLFANSFASTWFVGSRTFDISIEDTLYYDEFDQVAAAGGSGRAVVRSALVLVSDGDGIDILFEHGGASDPAIKAIEIRSGCATNAQCNDGAFCNGMERCIDDRCVAGTAPTEDDAIACTTSVCDENQDRFVHVPDHAACTDATFCNGEEICDPSGGCTSGEPVVLDDGVSCTMDLCNEAADRVDHIASDTMCDDDLFCNGLERCDIDDGCVAGIPPSTSDGVACTLDICDDQSRDLMHIPDDEACDDGLYCNGTERCDLSDGCINGSPPCSDGVACTTDACIESSDSCSFPPSHAACDDGDDCNGIEACDPVLGCIEGEEDDCAHLDSLCSVGICQSSEGSCSVEPINEGSNCDEGNACTLDDTCAGGVCLRLSYCGVPSSHGEIPVATDALFTIRAAVYLSDCPICECDVNADGRITASDGLIILSKSVGLDVGLNCFLSSN